MVTSPDIDDRQVNLKKFVNFYWDFKAEDNTGVSTKIYNNYDRLEFNENSADSIYDTGVGKFFHTTYVRGVDLQLSKQLFNNYRTICGFNYTDNKNDSTSSGKNEYSVQAAYLENQFDLFKDLKLNLATRVDNYSNFGSQVFPSADIQ